MEVVELFPLFTSTSWLPSPHLMGAAAEMTFPISHFQA